MALKAPVKATLAIAGVAALILASRLVPLVSWMESFIDRISTLGFTGAIVYIAVTVAAAVLFVPGLILTLGAGATFGLFRGTVVASLGSTLGAGAAFLVGRYLARKQVARWVAGNPRSAAIDAAVQKDGGKIVLLMRLSPVFPFNLLNYLFGLTGVGFWSYLLASWIGMLPATVMYVYLGAAGRAATKAAATGPAGLDGKALLWGMGLAATIALTWYLTRMARAALPDATETAPPASSSHPS
jgi:uncharacterized membrane protein YdjX (TVP38/TMEM64 family)